MVSKFFIGLMILIGVACNEPLKAILQHEFGEITYLDDDTIPIPTSTIGTNKDERYSESLRVEDQTFQRIPKDSVQDSKLDVIYPSIGRNSVIDGVTGENTGIFNSSLPKHSNVNNSPTIMLLQTTQLYAGIVAFSAVRAHTRSSMGNFKIQHVRFDRVISVVGDGWNPKDSYFRCVSPGIYVFTWSAVSPPKSETNIGLFVNGQQTGHELWAAKNGQQSASETAVISLNRGALVELRLIEGRLYEAANSRQALNSFSGFKLL